MNLLGAAVRLWQHVPLRLRKSVLAVPGLYPLANRLHSEELDVFPLSAPLEGHRMRLHWQTCKAYVFGTVEPQVVAAIKRTVQPQQCVLDLGANVGYFTLLLAKQVGPSGRVIAFEPHRKVFEVLRENVALNGYGQVIVENKAVVDRSGAVHLTQNDQRPLSHVESIVPGPGQEVEAVTLDDYFACSSDRIAFAKIDIEGAEARALDGMSRILRQDRPILVIELHGLAGRVEDHAAVERLRTAGYKVSVLDLQGNRAHILAEATGDR